MTEIRRTAVDERRAVAACVATALLHAPPTDEEFERVRPSYDDMASVSAWLGDRCVGHAGGFRFDTIVPGGTRLATSGVTRIGVLPTHRRRGLLTSLITELLVNAREEGRALASLRASEGVIYGRFGFGVAGDACEIEFRPAAARPLTGVAQGTMRLLEAKEILDLLPAIYDRAATRAGIITRPGWMWERYYRDALEEGGTASFAAVHTGLGGVDDGFVHYDIKWNESPATYATGEGEVWDLIGTTPAVELALWSYLADVDLVTTWRAEERPVDDIVRLAGRDPRCYLTKMRYDEQWLRLLDVDRALVARTYADVRPAVTVAIEDRLFAENNGVWRIAADGARRIDATAGDAELSASIAEASAAYMGGVPWRDLVAAGRVEEVRAGAAADADALFAVHPAPFSGSHF